MSLRPIDFQIPPQRRPSIIEDAFRVGLTTAAGELISRPFQIQREKRQAATELEQMKQRAAIDLANAKTLGDIQYQRHIEENYSELTPDIQQQLQTRGIDPATITETLNGKNYVSNQFRENLAVGTRKVSKDVTNFVDRVADLGGVPKRTEPLTAEDIGPIASLSGAIITGQDAQERARESKELVLSGFNQPPPQMFRGLGIKDTDAHGNTTIRPLTLSEQWAYGNGQEFQFAAQTRARNDPGLRRQLLEYYNQAKDIEGRVVPTDGLGLDAETARAQLGQIRGATPTGPLAQLLINMSREALDAGLLRDANGAVPDFRDAAKVITAIQGRPQLLEALFYASQYGDANDLKAAQQNGFAVPSNATVKGYLQEIYRRRSAVTGAPFQIDGAADISAVTVGNARDATVRAATTVPVDATGRGALPNTATPALPAHNTAPIVGFSGSPAQGLMYSAIYDRLKSNPADSLIVRDSTEAMFNGSFSDVMNNFRRLADKMPEPGKTVLLNQIAAMEQVPEPQRRAYLIRLKGGARNAYAQARDAALNQR